MPGLALASEGRIEAEVRVLNHRYDQALRDRRMGANMLSSVAIALVVHGVIVKQTVT